MLADSNRRASPGCTGKPPWDPAARALAPSPRFPEKPHQLLTGPAAGGCGRLSAHLGDLPPWGVNWSVGDFPLAHPTQAEAEPACWAPCPDRESSRRPTEPQGGRVSSGSVIPRGGGEGTRPQGPRGSAAAASAPTGPPAALPRRPSGQGGETCPDSCSLVNRQVERCLHARRRLFPNKQQPPDGSRGHAGRPPVPAPGGPGSSPPLLSVLPSSME